MFKLIFRSLIVLNLQFCSAAIASVASHPDGIERTASLQKKSIEETSQPLSLSASERVALSDNSSQVIDVHVSEYATMDTVFERVIGLGNYCATKSIINLYFSPSVDCRKTKSGQGNLFDWVFINDYQKLAEALQCRLEDIFELENLSVTSENHLKNKKYLMV